MYFIKSHKRKINEVLKKLLPPATFGIIFGTFQLLSSAGYEIDKTAYYYTLSTIPQTLASLIALIAVFSIYRLENIKKELIISKTKTIHKVNQDHFYYYTELLQITVTTGFFVIALTILLLPFGNIHSPENVPLLIFRIKPLVIVGFVLATCTVLLIYIIYSIFVIFEKSGN